MQDVMSKVMNLYAMNQGKMTFWQCFTHIKQQEKTHEQRSNTLSKENYRDGKTNLRDEQIHGYTYECKRVA
ncbi:MAG: hypothetical protein Unbinned200contig1002_25 [Prokaryotic dsDNA virus sp.]|nr:MAG: hypothetical protein Unbinned200contig1002_25 [Prokaryotic dsDNA virus sp.]